MIRNKLRGIQGFFKTKSLTSNRLFGILGGSGKVVVVNHVSRTLRLNDALLIKLWLFFTLNEVSGKLGLTN